MHNAFGEFQNALFQLLKVITDLKKTKHAVTITTNILFMCLFPCVGSNGTVGYFHSTLFPLKGQRLGYRFSQKYSNNPTNLENLSTPWLSNIFLSKYIFAFLHPNEVSGTGIHAFLK